MLGTVAERGRKANYQAAARQAYIGLGVAVIAAAFEEVDASPIEVFIPNLRSVVMMPLGYRSSEGDWLVNLKKVRRNRDKFITEIR